MENIESLISKFNLQPHIEGGYFNEDYRSPLTVSDRLVGKTDSGNRSLATTCYYLLTQKDRSIFHRLRSEEVWFFLHGGPLELYEICEESGISSKMTLGPEVSKGHELKHHVKAGTWFGALPQAGTNYCLLNCVVFPGFDFADWEKGDSSYLTKICPDAKEIIKMLT